MQTVALSWQHSFELAGLLAAGGGAMALSRRERVRFAGAFLRETAVIGILYGVWRRAGEVALLGTQGGLDRARWIQRVEHDLFLPSERSVQNLILGHPLLVQVANLYYAAMHFPMMFVFLIWLFVRHRDRYRPIRQVLAWTTLACLAIQMIPVAPPRMVPGIVDTAMLYDQSVYANGFAADQLSAMPSVHVAWAVLVGWYTWRVGGSRWRWLGPLHTVLTVFFVVATGNHWWLDGIVATALLSLAAWSVFGVRMLFRRLLTRWRVRRQGDAEPAPEPSRPEALEPA